MAVVTACLYRPQDYVAVHFQAKEQLKALLRVSSGSASLPQVAEAKTPQPMDADGEFLFYYRFTGAQALHPALRLTVGAYQATSQ